PEDVQEQIYRMACGEQSTAETIDGMLDRSLSSLTMLLSANLSPEEIAAALNITSEHRTNVIAPSGGTQNYIETGNGSGWERARLQPRIQSLITELQGIGVFTDDLIIRDGIVNKRMLRRASYTLIEIPRLDWREVLVCNQVGEASRISLVPQGIETYENLSKPELDQMPGISRKICQHINLWAPATVESLESNLEENRKINVQLLESVRVELKERYSAEQWLEMQPADIANIEVANNTFASLVHQITGEQYVSNRECQIRWAGRVFGFGNTTVREADDEMFRQSELPIAEINDWRQSIIQEFPTVDSWMNVLNDEQAKERAKRLLYTLGFSIDAIASLRSLAFIGARVYGHNHQSIKSAMEQPEDTLKYGMEHRYRNTGVSNIGQKLDDIQELVALGLPSLKIVRNVQRKSEFLLEVIEEAILYVRTEADKKGCSPSVDAIQAEPSEIELSWNLNNMYGLIDSYIRGGESEGFDRAIGVLSQLRTLLLSEIERAREIEAMVRLQIMPQHAGNGLTMYTPLVSVPELDLTQAERQLLQLLLNDNQQYIPELFIRQILDRPALNHDPSYRGTVIAIVNSLRNKLADAEYRFRGISKAIINDNYIVYTLSEYTDDGRRLT
ncbi:hypothetical protein KKG16_04035, partial [Patescibacteria group bacterium]|nr:hypothetical protein [Patescibacteria group bacterium]